MVLKKEIHFSEPDRKYWHHRLPTLYSHPQVQACSLGWKWQMIRGGWDTSWVTARSPDFSGLFRKSWKVKIGHWTLTLFLFALSLFNQKWNLTSPRPSKLATSTRSLRLYLSRVSKYSQVKTNSFAVSICRWVQGYSWFLFKLLSVQGTILLPYRSTNPAGSVLVSAVPLPGTGLLSFLVTWPTSTGFQVLD